MKLIDLFIKIANGEKTPEKIKFDYKIFTHNGDSGNKYYICKEKGKLLEESFIFEDLNNEVEIIEDTLEENKRIEKIGLSELYGIEFNEAKYTICKKINEIIDSINKKND